MGRKKFQLPAQLLSEDIRNWGDFAQCKGKPAEWWYAENHHTMQGKIDTQRAKALCETCIVRTQCLNYANENEESFGIWGGLTPKERGYFRNRKGRRVVQPN